jgi:hypothetical protein
MFHLPGMQKVRRRKIERRRAEALRKGGPRTVITLIRLRIAKVLNG